LLWEFEQQGIEGRNPCEDVHVYHVHRKRTSDKRQRPSPVDYEWQEVRARALLGIHGSGYRSASEVDDSEEDTRGDAGRVPMPVVNTNGRSSIAFPDGLKRKRPQNA
jgi:hypothetical protein